MSIETTICIQYLQYLLVSVLSKKSVSFAEPPAPSKGGGSKPNPLVKMVRGMWASRWGHVTCGDMAPVWWVIMQGDAQREHRPPDHHEDHAQGAHRLLVRMWGTIATEDCSWNICTNKSPRWIHETMLQLLSSDRDLQFQQKAGSLTTANIHNENMSKLLSPCLRPRHVVIKVGVFIYADLTQVSTSQFKGEWPFIFEYLIDNNVLNFAWVENKLIFNLIRTSKLKTVQFTQNIHTKCSWFTQCISMSQTLPTQH